MELWTRGHRAPHCIEATALASHSLRRTAYCKAFLILTSAFPLPCSPASLLPYFQVRRTIESTGYPRHRTHFIKGPVEQVPLLEALVVLEKDRERHT